MSTDPNVLTANERSNMWTARNDGWDNGQAWNASRYIEYLEKLVAARDAELQQAQTRLTKAMYLILDKT